MSLEAGAAAHLLAQVLATGRLPPHLAAALRLGAPYRFDCTGLVHRADAQSRAGWALLVDGAVVANLVTDPYNFGTLSRMRKLVALDVP